MTGIALLLEDDDLDAELLEAQLAGEGLGLRIRRVADEASYLELLKTSEVGLILSDFSLPSYGGLAALAAARELAPEAPFIFVSGAIGEELAIDSMRRGATDYVLKHRLDRLGPAVRRALGEVETRRLRAEAEAERDRLLKSEREAREAAESANRLKDEFLAVVSHELRTPLQAIVGWANLLAGQACDAETRERGLRTILRNAEVQCRLIDDILDLSRITSGKLNLHVAPVMVEGIVAAAVEAIRPAAAAKGLSLELQVAPDAGEIQADAERLQQVVWNLVSNAVKFTEAGGLVCVSAERQDDVLRIEVRDTGAGIEPSLLPEVFDRFRQADPSRTRRHGGLGLGLAIVRHLTEMHGGTVKASSEGLGRGSTFLVCLPARTLPLSLPPSVPEPPASESRPPPPHEEAPQALLAGVRVLVVDDEPDALSLVSEVFRLSGAAVTTAGTVRDALEAFAACQPDVIVSDIGMPNVDGYGLLRRLRRLPAEEGGNVPAIALTAYARPADVAEAARAGYQRHLAKPVAPQDLVEAVAGLLKGRGSALAAS